MSLEPNQVSTNQGKYFGEYIGRVESVSDPDHLMRVQVRVMVIHTDKVPTKDLPWAEYKLPVGARVNDGFFTPVDVGDWVWIDYPYNFDPRRPRITGSVHHAPGGTPNFPHESFAGAQKLTHKTTGEEPAPTAAGYHRDVVYTQHGVTIEVNEDKSIAITQRETGTAIRVSPQGDITLHGEKSIYMSAIENLKVIVEGNAQIDVTGNSDITTRGATTVKSMGKATYQSDEEISIVAPAVNITTAALGMGGGGAAAILTGNFEILGDIDVTGNVSATGDIIDGGSNTNHHGH